MVTPSDPAGWKDLTARLRVHSARTYLLVTNRGPRGEGYTYCTICGLIEPNALREGQVGSMHAKPYPDPREQNCRSGRVTRGLVLGTDFISDVLLNPLVLNNHSLCVLDCCQPTLLCEQSVRL